MEIPLLVMPIMISQILKSVDFTKAQKSRYLENKILFFLQIKNVSITIPCTHLLYPAHFSLQLALCNTLNVIRTKISHVIGQFPKFRLKNSKFSILPENWHTWYLEDADSCSDISFLNFQS